MTFFLISLLLTTDLVHLSVLRWIERIGLQIVPGIRSSWGEESYTLAVRASGLAVLFMLQMVCFKRLGLYMMSSRTNIR